MIKADISNIVNSWKEFNGNFDIDYCPEMSDSFKEPLFSKDFSFMNEEDFNELSEHIFKFDSEENSILILSSLVASLLSEKLKSINIQVPTVKLLSNTEINLDIVNSILYPMLGFENVKPCLNTYRDNHYTEEGRKLFNFSIELNHYHKFSQLPVFANVCYPSEVLKKLKVNGTTFESLVPNNFINLLNSEGIINKLFANKPNDFNYNYDIQYECLMQSIYSIELMLNLAKDTGKLWIIKENGSQNLICEDNVLNIDLENTILEPNLKLDMSELLQNFGKTLYFESLFTPISELEQVKNSVIRDFKGHKDINSIMSVMCGLRVMINAIDRVTGGTFYFNNIDRLMPEHMKDLKARLINTIVSSNRF